MARKRLGEMLLEAGVIDEHKLHAALGHQRKWGGRLGQALVDLKLATEAQIVEALSQKFGYEVVKPEALQPNPHLESALKLLPREFAQKANLVPFQADSSAISVAMSDPANIAVVDEIRFRTGRRVKIVLGGDRELAEAVKRLYFTSGDHEAIALDFEELDQPVEPIVEQFVGGSAEAYDSFYAAPAAVQRPAAEAPPAAAEARKPAAVAEAKKPIATAEAKKPAAIAGAAPAAPAPAPAAPSSAAAHARSAPAPAPARAPSPARSAPEAAPAPRPSPVAGALPRPGAAPRPVPAAGAVAARKGPMPLELEELTPGRAGPRLRPEARTTPPEGPEPGAAPGAEAAPAEPEEKTQTLELPIDEAEPTDTSGETANLWKAGPLQGPPEEPAQGGAAAGNGGEAELRLLEVIDRMADGEPVAPEVVKPAQMAAALIRLLIRKGVISEAEFLEEFRGK